MASNDYRIIPPFFPTLKHLASVRIGLPLLQKFGKATLEGVFREIQAGRPSGTNDADSRRAKTFLERMEERVRKQILRAVRGMDSLMNIWRMDHFDILRFTGGSCSEYHWRSDGSIDTMRIVEDMMQNENIGVLGKFEIAGKFCLVQHIMNLAPELRDSGELEELWKSDNWMVRFWVRWVRTRFPCPWEAVLARDIDIPSPLSFMSLKGRQSRFFPLLTPRQRRKFLDTVAWTTSDDFRFCLQAMTEVEQEEVVVSNASGVLFRLMKWPLRDSFLETAYQLWGKVGPWSFGCLLECIHFNCRDDPDHETIFREFWERSPHHLKNSARSTEFISQRIDSHFPAANSANKRQKR